MEVLTCETCPISLNAQADTLAERMCPVVGGKVLSRLTEAGIDASSDMTDGKELLGKVIEYPTVKALAEIACQERLLLLENSRRGYSTVSY